MELEGHLVWGVTERVFRNSGMRGCECAFALLFALLMMDVHYRPRGHRKLDTGFLRRLYIAYY